MNLFTQNIRFLRNQAKLTQQGLAEKLDITKARLGAYEEGRSEPPYDLLLKLAEFFNIPLDLLLKQNLEELGAGAFIPMDGNKVLFPVMVNENNEDLIEVIPDNYRAAAGYLSGRPDDEYTGNLETIRLPYKVDGKLRAFPIKGDSMLPIPSGSYVIGKFVERTSELKSGKLYIIVTKEPEIVFKRVYNQIQKNGLLLMESLNPFYQPYTIPADQIMQAWQYVAYISNDEPSDTLISMQQVMDKLEEISKKIETIS